MRAGGRLRQNCNPRRPRPRPTFPVAVSPIPQVCPLGVAGRARPHQLAGLDSKAWRGGISETVRAEIQPVPFFRGRHFLGHIFGVRGLQGDEFVCPRWSGSVWRHVNCNRYIRRQRLRCDGPVAHFLSWRDGREFLPPKIHRICHSRHLFRQKFVKVAKKLGVQRQKENSDRFGGSGPQPQTCGRSQGSEANPLQNVRCKVGRSRTQETCGREE